MERIERSGANIAPRVARVIRITPRRVFLSEHLKTTTAGARTFRFPPTGTA
jgi:hypothetical protein